MDIKSPSVERLTWLRDELSPWLERYFKAERVESALFAVAQYWADEADDAVHLTALASTGPVPDFFADEYGETPSPDTRSIDWRNRPDWDDNGSSIRAFQALCGESGSQELASADQAEPFALAVRTPTGPELFPLAPLQRPWLDLPTAALPAYLGGDDDTDSRDRPRLDLTLDAQALAADDVRCLEAIAAEPLSEGPRRVWADMWLARNDPRGAFMQQRRPSTDQLIERGEYWLGELNRVVPLASAVFEYGSLAEADVAFQEEDEALAHSPWWLSVHTLRQSGEHQWFSPMMRGLRHVSGLTAPGLLALADFDGTSRLESLQVTVSQASAELLHALPLDGLRALSVTLEDGADVRFLSKLTNCPKLERLRVSTAWRPTYGDDEPPQTLPSLSELSAISKVKRVATSSADAANRPAGFELSLEGGAASLAMLRLSPCARRSVLDGLLEGLAADVTTVRLVPSLVFKPTAAFDVGKKRRPLLP